MRAALTLALAAAATSAACKDTIKPDRAPDARPVDIVFLDDRSQLQVVRSGQQPVATSLTGVVPFAATKGAVAYWTDAGLALYHLDGRTEALPVPNGPAQTFGAISPGGERLAYVSTPPGHVFLHVVQLTSGARDSLDVLNREDAVAAQQIAFSTPVWSPSGDSVAFLLPNPLTVQAMVYEVSTRRIEAFPLGVPPTYVPLPGWPRWMPDGTIRFLALYFVDRTPTDTLLMVRVFPRVHGRPAEVVSVAEPPDSIPMQSLFSYSFDEAGRAAALTMGGDRALGLFVFRERRPRLETVLYDQRVTPRFALLVP